MDQSQAAGDHRVPEHPDSHTHGQDGQEAETLFTEGVFCKKLARYLL